MESFTTARAISAGLKNFREQLPSQHCRISSLQYTFVVDFFERATIFDGHCAQSSGPSGLFKHGYKPGIARRAMSTFRRLPD
jgi:hypothetical protein